jgi:hypothetical protein
MQGQGFQHIAPLVKSHFSQGRIPHGAAIVEHLFKIKSFGTGGSERRPGYCIKKDLSVPVTRDPFPGNIVFQFSHMQTFNKTKLAENAKNRDE